jgi:hypothetical protein
VTQQKLDFTQVPGSDGEISRAFVRRIEFRVAIHLDDVVAESDGD